MNTETEMPFFMTVAQVAQILACSQKTVRKLIAYAILPASRVGAGRQKSPFRISRDDLMAYMKGTRTM